MNHPLIPTKTSEFLVNHRQPSVSHPTLRIGAVSYLNSKPLIHGLEESLEGQGKLSLALPSQLADCLAQGTIDVGLIPVVEYFPHPDYRIISNAAIACRGPVWSVRVFFRTEPCDVKTLALDEGSRTSATLIKVLFHQRFGFVPKCVPLEMSRDPLSVDTDAVLVIGDRAMHPETFRPKFRSDWDLGQVWLEETGLPFVFALWVARSESFATDALASVLENARDQGQNAVPEIAMRSAGKYGLTEQQCQDYLTNYIRFHLRSEEQAGLAEFQKRCFALGLI